MSYDWGKQEQVAGADLKWDGVAAYVNYAINGQWRVSLRGEYVDDKDGFITGTPQKLKEGTLTFGYAPLKNFELRLEARYDDLRPVDLPEVDPRRWRRPRLRRQPDRACRPGAVQVLAAGRSEGCTKT